MPTIPQLPNATQSSVEDEIPVSQGGVTRAVTVAELLSGTQQVIEVPSQSLLGRASLGPGGPEALSIGTGLTLQGAAVTANGSDHGGFVQESGLGSGDEVIINAAGTPKRVPATALRSLFAGGKNVTIDTTGSVAAYTDPAVSASLTSLTQGISTAETNIAVVASKLPAGGFAALNGSGQVTSPIAGDLSAGAFACAHGGVSRNIASRALDCTNVMDFGAVPGGGDCSAAFNAAFVQLPNSGGEIWIPAGDFWLASSLVWSGKPLTIRGAGKGQTRLHFQHTGVGLDLAPGNVLSKVCLSNLSLFAESGTGQTAAGIRISFPSTSALGYVSVTINSIEFFGYPNAANGTFPFPQTFLRGVVLNNCWSSQLNDISWFGPPAAPGSTTSAVVEVNGSVDTRLTSIQAYYGNAVVLQTAYCEGLYLNNPLVVGVDYLVKQTDETKWPGYVPGKPMLLGLWVANGEVNTNLGTVQLSNVTDGFFANLDITRDGGPNTPQTFFDLKNVSNFHVTGCNFVGGPTGGSSQDTAFQFNSTSNSSSNIVGSCHFEDMATVIQIVAGNGTVGLTTYALSLGNVPLATAILDASVQESGNYLSFMTPSRSGVPVGLGNTKDHLFTGAGGEPFFRINNVAGAANFIRHQPATRSNPPTICFDGTDGTVNGVIQTKGGSLFINAAGGSGGSGNMLSLFNTPGAANWVTLQNAASGNLSLIATNNGGLGLQPKGALWLSAGTGLFVSGLPTTKPLTGTGQVWNNNGVLSVA